MNKYKMLVLDLDGTLTNNNKMVSKRNKAAIFKAMDMGLKVVLASGRPSFGILPIAKELEFDKRKGYIISYNGGKIIDMMNNDVIYKKVISKKEQIELFKLINKNNLDVAVTKDNDILITNNINNIYVNLEASINKMDILQVNDIENYLDCEIPKFVLFYDKKNADRDINLNFMKKNYIPFPDYSIAKESDIEYLKDKEIILRDILKDRFEVYRSEPFFLEILPKGIDKAKTLERFINIMGISREELIACGDSYNDISMIKFAGLGVAMKNAVNEAKEAADYITDTNDNDGVAKVIEKFILSDI